MELEKIKKVNEILQLCFEINEFEQRQKEYTGDKPTIFVRFSGHVALLNIQVYNTGWYSCEEEDNYAQPDTKFEIYLCYPYLKIKEYIEECIVYLKTLKALMEKRENHECLQQAI